MEKRQRSKKTSPTKSTGNDNWPGRTAGNPSPTKHPNHWNPAGYGPGMGPELISDSQKPDPETTTEAGGNPVWESCTISEAADKLVRFRIGDECPNCGFAKLSLDADNHVSCPICGFGAYRACG